MQLVHQPREVVVQCLLDEHLAHRRVEAFDLDQVPGDVLDRAKLNILDALGIGFASVGFDFAERLAVQDLRSLLVDSFNIIHTVR